MGNFLLFLLPLAYLCNAINPPKSSPLIVSPPNDTDTNISSLGVPIGSEALTGLTYGLNWLPSQPSTLLN